MEWESPWGTGFPGWHLECSVMSRELLGDQLDIHTGGIDHIPVHHTNEIAQSEAVTGKRFSQFWVHANHIKVDGTKMSKSLGNIYTLEDIQQKGFAVSAFKLLVLSKHYRTEGNFTWENLEAAQNRLRALQAFADLRFQDNPEASLLSDDYFDQNYEAILTCLQNDLNTPKAIQILGEMADHIEKYGQGLHTSHLSKFSDFLVSIDELLGLGFARSQDITHEQKQLLHQRRAAREHKDWATSDQLRDALKEQGLVVRDTSNDQIWSRT